MLFLELYTENMQVYRMTSLPFNYSHIGKGASFVFISFTKGANRKEKEKSASKFSRRIE